MTVQEVYEALQKALQEYPGIKHTPLFLNVRTDEVESSIESIGYGEGGVYAETPDTLSE
jgi:hypothetical protein